MALAANRRSIRGGRFARVVPVSSRALIRTKPDRRHLLGGNRRAHRVPKSSDTTLRGWDRHAERWHKHDIQQAQAAAVRSAPRPRLAPRTSATLPRSRSVVRHEAIPQLVQIRGCRTVRYVTLKQRRGYHSAHRARSPAARCPESETAGRSAWFARGTTAPARHPQRNGSGSSICVNSDLRPGTSIPVT